MQRLNIKELELQITQARHKIRGAQFNLLTSIMQNLTIKERKLFELQITQT